MNDDTISRAAAIEAINERIAELMRNPIYRKKNADIDLYGAKRLILGLPSVRSDIIRCKDCKYLFKDGKCPLRLWFTHTEDDFCSYAERKTDG